MTLKNNRTHLQCYFKLCASFHSHLWIQTGVTVRKNSTIFRAVWPWYLADDLEKQQGTSSKQHQALCIISSLYVNSNWSYSPETGWVVTSVTLTFDLWPWPFAWTSLLSLVITPENFVMIRWWEHSQKGVTDGQADRRTEPFIELLGRSLTDSNVGWFNIGPTSVLSTSSLRWANVGSTYIAVWEIRKKNKPMAVCTGPLFMMRQRQRQTDRQTDRRTDRQTDRQRDRDRETERQRQNKNSYRNKYL